MTLEEASKLVEDLRTRLLFDEESLAVGLDVIAEQELLAGLAYLELAKVALMRGHYHQVRALAQSPHR